MPLTRSFGCTAGIIATIITARGATIATVTGITTIVAITTITGELSAI